MALIHRSGRKGDSFGSFGSSGSVLGLQDYSAPDIASDDLAQDVTISDLPEGVPGDRHSAISAIAYRLAQRRGFAPGYELEDWLYAERRVDDLLAEAAQTKQL